MILSRSLLRQILAMDLIESVIDGVTSSNSELSGDMRRKADHALGMLKIERGRWWFAVVGQTNLELEPKDYRKYLREISKLKNTLKRKYGQEMDAIEYLNAVLFVVEETVYSVPRSPIRRRLAAIRCRDALADLYALYDPNLEEVERIEAGAMLGGQFKQTVGVW